MQNLKNLDQNLKSPLICELFEKTASLNPDSLAALTLDREITYRELDLQSNQLANYLIKKGVGPGKIVGLFFDCDLSLLIGLLGILKAGGVYFPLDPNYPKERLRYMIEDATPHLILTYSRYQDQLKAHSQTVFFDIEKDLIESFGNAPPRVKSSPEDLAYLIYTSGSTGKPKGIMIPHKSVALAALARENVYPKKVRGLVTGSISFDASLITIFPTLTEGGIVCLAGSSLMDPDATIQFIHEKSIDFLMCVPSLYSMLLEKKKEMPSLKAVSLGGESLPRYIPALHRQFAPNAILFNEYGPSEWAMGTTIAKIVDPATSKIKEITIGSPHPGAEIYLLDDKFQMVPKGEKGEIFISGDGLALGYLNQPDLTKERFFSLSLQGKSIRVYRTGDYARLLPEGELEYLGRIDTQVKIRGFRIELGEIEESLKQYDSIQEVVVLMKEKQLIAYYTGHREIETGKLKAFLSLRVPSAAVPSHFVYLERFSRTPNGKINRSTLPALFLPSPSESDLPQGETETLIALIWNKVLEKNIGVNENFFEAGGDSMSLVVLQTALSAQLQITISIIDLLEYPTIRRFAAHLDKPEKMALSQNKRKTVPLFRARLKK